MSQFNYNTPLDAPFDEPTPLEYKKASLVNRFVAAIIDNLITAGLSIPALYFAFSGISDHDYSEDVSGSDTNSFRVILAALFFILPVGYRLIKDGIGNGQSYGKKAMNLKMVCINDHTPCTKGQSIARNLISFIISVLPLGGLIDIIVILASKDGRRIGDHAAGTQVVDC